MTKPARAARKRSARRTRRGQSATSSPAPSGARWLLLIHQIPPKPDYLRVKIGRRLQRVGAVAIKNSVYVLPSTPESYEDFQWIVREVVEGGGDAFVSESSLLGEELTDETVRARFNAARNEGYRAILTDAGDLLMMARSQAKKPDRARSGAKANGTQPDVEHELAKLSRRYEAVRAIDFFKASEGAAVATTLAHIRQAIHQQRAAMRQPVVRVRRNGATWVTRRDVHVDRIASAWLIRRFIDRRARFRFVDPKRHLHRQGELRFDMFEAEYTHAGDSCTFEALVAEFVPRDRALRDIAEIVHDVDCKDGKFRRDEAPGLARMIAGVAANCARDEHRLARGARLFDDLYAAFGGPPVTATRAPSRSLSSHGDASAGRTPRG